jgi:uncharacterized protein YndB with AHSA1/START domain
MTERSANHHTFIIEREFAYPPSLVFFAYSNPEAKKVWFRGPEDWDRGEASHDFRVGGREKSSGGPKGQWTSTYDSEYLEIVPDARIINAFMMYIDGKPLTASLATTEFKPSAKGTKLVFTEQIVFLDGSDHLENRIEGTEGMFNNLEAYINRTHAAA